MTLDGFIEAMTTVKDGWYVTNKGALRRGVWGVRQEPQCLLTALYEQRTGEHLPVANGDYCGRRLGLGEEEIGQVIDVSDYWTSIVPNDPTWRDRKSTRLNSSH